VRASRVLQQTMRRRRQTAGICSSAHGNSSRRTTGVPHRFSPGSRHHARVSAKQNVPPRTRFTETNGACRIDAGAVAEYYRHGMFARPIETRGRKETTAALKQVAVTSIKEEYGDSGWPLLQAAQAGGLLAMRRIAALRVVVASAAAASVQRAH